jgi:hypothetical protein
VQVGKGEGREGCVRCVVCSCGKVSQFDLEVWGHGLELRSPGRQRTNTRIIFFLLSSPHRRGFRKVQPVSEHIYQEHVTRHFGLSLMLLSTELGMMSGNRLCYSVAFFLSAAYKGTPKPTQNQGRARGTQGRAKEGFLPHPRSWNCHREIRQIPRKCCTNVTSR